ncbi:MAG: tetratricopeptide repeat protein [Planctomycetota bacterium]|nr:tetratricopeptide repeat protein [Planctomycetota bacterium]
MNCSKCKKKIADDSKFCPECGIPLFTYDDITLRVAEPERTFLERYVILSVVGRGATGTVYRAKDLQLDEFIAMKMLPQEFATDHTAVERMREETRIARTLRHENIAAIYDFQIDNKRNACFITMEFVDGMDLSNLLKEKGRFSLEEVLPIVEQISSAVDYAHSKKVVHRDIKPKNIMLTRDGLVKVTDFSIAKRIREEMARVSQTSIEGTPAYMAPEHLLGEKKIDHRIDIYSLGATVYELLSGEPPYQGSSEQVVAQVIKNKKVKAIKGLPDFVNKALMRALSHTPAERFSSASNFYTALSGFSSSKETPKRDKSFAIKLPLPKEPKKEDEDDAVETKQEMQKETPKLQIRVRELMRGKINEQRVEATVADSSSPPEESDEVELLYKQGVEALSRGDFESAIADFKKVLRLNRDYGERLNLKLADALNARGLAKAGKGDLEGAIADYTEALELSPNNAVVFNNRGNVLMKKGDHKSAMADFDRALQLNPRFSLAFYNRGFAKYYESDLEGAIRDFTEAIRLNPCDSNAFYGRGTAKSDIGDYEGSIADYDEAIRLNPRNAMALYRRGLAKKKKGSYSEAVADWEKAREMNPSSWHIWMELAIAYAKRGDKKNVLEALEKLLQLNPQIRKWVKNDKVFEWLHKDPLFTRLIK